MIKLNLRYGYNKLSMMTKMEIKRISNQLPNVILLVLLLILFVNMFIFLSKNNDNTNISNIAICIEDNSIEVKTLMKNITENKLKDIVNFEEVPLDKGFEQLRNNEVIALIHVNEGTADLLNNGEAAAFNLYIKHTSNITVKFLIDYLKNLVNVLNEGQSGAMIYWDIMKDDGFDFNARLDELNKTALDYMAAFLTRGNVFEKIDDFDKFYGASIINYYFTTSLLIISIISAILFHSDIDDDLRKGRIIRAVNSGFSYWHIYCAKIIAGLMFSILIVVFFKIIYMIFFDVFYIENLIKFIIYFTLVSIIIHMLVITIYNLITKEILRDSFFIIIFFIITFASGIILPLTSMNKVFKYLSKINFLTIGHNLLLGYPLTISRGSVILAYYLIFIVLITYTCKKRSV